jgi:hypothetical protein
MGILPSSPNTSHKPTHLPMEGSFASTKLLETGLDVPEDLNSQTSRNSRTLFSPTSTLMEDNTLIPMIPNPSLQTLWQEVLVDMTPATSGTPENVLEVQDPVTMRMSVHTNKMDTSVDDAMSKRNILKIQSPNQTEKPLKRPCH